MLQPYSKQDMIEQMALYLCLVIEVCVTAVVSSCSQSRKYLIAPCIMTVLSWRQDIRIWYLVKAHTWFNTYNLNIFNLLILNVTDRPSFVWMIRRAHFKATRLHILTLVLFKTIFPQLFPHPFPKFSAKFGSKPGIFGQQLQTMLYTRFRFNFWATGSKCDGAIRYSNTSWPSSTIRLLLKMSK